MLNNVIETPQRRFKPLAIHLYSKTTKRSLKPSIKAIRVSSKDIKIIGRHNEEIPINSNTEVIITKDSIEIIKKYLRFDHKIKIGVDNDFYKKRIGYKQVCITYSILQYRNYDLSFIASINNIGIGIEKKLYKNIYAGSFIVVDFKSTNLQVKLTLTMEVL